MADDWVKDPRQSAEEIYAEPEGVEREASTQCPSASNSNRSEVCEDDSAVRPAQTNLQDDLPSEARDIGRQTWWTSDVDDCAQELIWQPPSMRQLASVLPADSSSAAEITPDTIETVEIETVERGEEPELERSDSAGTGDVGAGDVAKPRAFSFQERPVRSARSAEVQALQAEVAMQEVQLRRLLTTQHDDHVSDEIAFEAARLWQGLESIRSVIATLQESLTDARREPGFVEDAYVAKTAKGTSDPQGDHGGEDPFGDSGGQSGYPVIGPDGFDEIARLEAATAALTKQPRERLLEDTKNIRTRRQGAFRGLVRGSGTGGGASSSSSHAGSAIPSTAGLPSCAVVTQRRLAQNGQQATTTSHTGSVVRRQTSPSSDASRAPRK